MANSNDNKSVAAQLAAALYARNNNSGGLPAQEIVETYRQVLALLDNVDAAEAKLRTDAWLDSMRAG